MDNNALIANLILDLLLVVEGTGMPGVPFQPAFFVVAMYITQGKAPFLLCWILASLANLLGNVLGYLIGNKLGEAFVLKLKFLRLEPDDVDDLRSLANKYGPWVVVISRWFGPIRTPTILLAGTIGMNLPIYTLFSSMGAFSWNFAWLWATWQGSRLLLTILGANASQNWLIAMLIGWGLALVSLTVVMGAWHRYKNNRDSAEKDVNDDVNDHSEQHAK